MYDFRARVWSPDLGVFVQADRFGFVGPKTTLWGWPGGNPIKNHDPTGRLANLPYFSLGEAMKDAMTSAWVLTRMKRWEFGGAVVELGGLYYYAPPTTTNRDDAIDTAKLFAPSAGYLAAGARVVAIYHSHPGASPVPSGADLNGVATDDTRYGFGMHIPSYIIRNEVSGAYCEISKNGACSIPTGSFGIVDAPDGNWSDTYWDAPSDIYPADNVYRVLSVPGDM